MYVVNEYRMPKTNESFDARSYLQSEFAEELEGVEGMENCDGLEQSQVEACVTSLLMEQARLTKDDSYCERITNNPQMNACLELVARLEAAVEYDRSSICHEYGTDRCTDIVMLLAGIDTSDTALCAKIVDADLQRYCLSVLGVDTVAELAIEEVQNPCDLGDTLCETRASVRKEALRSGNPVLCDQLVELADECRYEVAMYQVYKSQSTEGCSQFQAPEQVQDCNFAVTIGAALAQGTPESCLALPENLQEGCSNIVELGVYPRFVGIE